MKKLINIFCISKFNLYEHMYNFKEHSYIHFLELQFIFVKKYSDACMYQGYEPIHILPT
jgi:hypothetical protein